MASSLIVVKAFVKRGDFKVSVGKVGGLEKDWKKVFSDFKLVSNGLKFQFHETIIASQSETLQPSDGILMVI